MARKPPFKVELVTAEALVVAADETLIVKVISDHRDDAMAEGLAEELSALLGEGRSLVLNVYGDTDVEFAVCKSGAEPG